MISATFYEDSYYKDLHQFAKISGAISQDTLMTVQVRAALPEDAVAISQVIIEALRQSNARDYPPEVIAQVAQHFAPSHVLSLINGRRVYVATVNDRVIGTASLDQSVVRSVFVDPALQGIGIGKQLMATLERAAACEGVRLLQVPSSITAEGFYEALGFRKVRDEFHGAERTIIMDKPLDPAH